MSPHKPPPKAKPKPYPYTIPSPPTLSKETAGRLNPFAVLEFLRIEALLRSNLVFTYLRWPQKDRKKSTPKEDFKEAALLEDFHFSLHDSLQGKHHTLLNPDAETYQIGLINFSKSALSKSTGMLDLTPVYQTWFKEIDRGHEIDLALDIRRRVNSQDLRIIQLDVAFPPTTILNALEECLSKWHKGVTKSVKKVARTKMRVKPVSLITWIAYFQCYDLREEKGLTFDAIAKQVYGTGNNPKEREQKIDRAETAHIRAQELIKLAEKKEWPPPGSFLRGNKKPKKARKPALKS